MKRTVLIIMFVTLLSKALGFIRDIVLSYFYGASVISDAYLIAITIPNVLFVIIVIGITTGYIPTYSKIKFRHSDIETNKFTNSIVSILMIICTILIIIVLIYTENIVKIFASGFDKETLEIAVSFTRISIFGVYFTGLIHIFTGFLQIKGNYIIPSMIGFPLSFITIIFILLSVNYSHTYIAIGSTVALFAQFIMLLPFIKKSGYKYKPEMNLKNKYIINMGLTAIPVILSTGVIQLNVLVDRNLASNIAIGGISSIHYANIITGFVQGVFVLSISTVMFPSISKLVAAGKRKELKTPVQNSINLVNLLVIPISIMTMFYAAPIVELLFGRGEFNDEAVKMTSHALRFYSLGIIGLGLREIFTKVFYSIQNTKTPMQNAMITVLMNIILSITLSQFMGIGGIALATSISTIVCTILLYINLQNKVIRLDSKNLIISTIKIIIISLSIGIVSKYFFNMFGEIIGSGLSLIAIFVISSMCYCVVVYILKIGNVNEFINSNLLLIKNNLNGKDKKSE